MRERQVAVIHELKCFGTQTGEGNPALVLLEGAQDIAERQAFAAQSGVSACVFVDRGDQQAAYVLDYFYPHARSPLCLHATLAAARVLLEQRTQPLTVRTAMRGQLLELSQAGDDVFISLRHQPAPSPELPPGLVQQLLNDEALELASAPVVASVGSPKLLLEVRDSATLLGLRPDLARITQWGKEHGVNGCYVWCRRADGHLEGRNFNHLDPAAEDTATGVAAGALTAHLQSALLIYQGSHLGQPCMIRTRLVQDTIQIGGAAEFAHHNRA
ncbi:hypothetical protein ACZ75_25630 [Massilia sp. NR 4-1]|nr:hypothetical protein ACZ75_25630 [Massilia sp. NR 4-1]